MKINLISLSRASFLLVAAISLTAIHPPLFAIPTKPPQTVPPASVPAIDIARSLGNTFAVVAEKVSPAIVVVTVTRSPGAEEGDDTPFEPYEIPSPAPRGSAPPRRSPPLQRDFIESQGSGFIVRADGYIYTNSHVIQGADKIRVKLKDGRSFDAQIVGVPDDKTDVAVIKIEAKRLPVVEMGDSDAIRPGEWTIAIGAPFNLDYSVTVGVLSGKYRGGLGAVVYEEYLQTQATINPGNSGGPLLDIDGKVIGINTLIKTRGGGGPSYYNANVGFAIPIKLAKKIGNILMTKGKVERPWLGVDIRTLSEATELKGSIRGVSQGVLIMAIKPDAPAYRSGLKPGDVIVSIDNLPVKEARDLQKQVLEKQIGQSVHLDLIRDGKPLSIDVKTGLQPSTIPVSNRSPPSPSPPHQTYGVTVQPLNKELIDQFHLSEKHGLLVMNVEEGSAAARSELMPGMVITEVDGKKVSTTQAFKEALRKSDSKRGSMLQVSRDGIRTFLILRLNPPVDSP